MKRAHQKQMKYARFWDFATLVVHAVLAFSGLVQAEVPNVPDADWEQLDEIRPKSGSAAGLLGFSTDGSRLIYTAGEELVVYDLKSKSSRRMWLPSNSFGPRLQSISRDGRYFAIRVWKNKVECFSLVDFRRIGVLDFGETRVESLAFSRDGKYLAVALEGDGPTTQNPTKLPESRIKFYEVTNWQCFAEVRLSLAQIDQLIVPGHGKFLFASDQSFGSPAILVPWILEDVPPKVVRGQVLHALYPLVTDSLMWMSLSEDDKTLATIYANGVCRIYSCENWEQPSFVIPTPASLILRDSNCYYPFGCISPSGRYLYVLAEEFDPPEQEEVTRSVLKVWDLKARRICKTVSCNPDWEFWVAAISRDGTKLAISSHLRRLPAVENDKQSSQGRIVIWKVPQQYVDGLAADPRK